MKKAFIIIALIIVFCSISVSAAPFNLVVGKEGFRSIDKRNINPFNFEFSFSRDIFVDEARMEAFRNYNRCGGYWFVDVYSLGEIIKRSDPQDICKRLEYSGRLVCDSRWSASLCRDKYVSGGCARIANLHLSKGDKFVIKSANLRSECSRGGCEPEISGSVFFIEGKSIPSAISSRSGIVGFGSVKSIIDGFSFVETSGDSFVVKSSNPRVLIWVGGEFDHDALVASTDNWFDNVWACYDGDLNQKCDFAEDDECSAYGGDFYKGVCCGRDVECGYVDFWGDKEINAWCGLLDNGNWAWLAEENVGEIFDFDCPGTMVSDGDSFVSCSDFFGPLDYKILDGPEKECPKGYVSVIRGVNNEFNMWYEDSFNVCVNSPNFKVMQGENKFSIPACPDGFEDLGTVIKFGELPSSIAFLRICAKKSVVSSFFNLSTEYGSKEYVCLGDDMFECSAGVPFSSHNSAALGETTLGLSDLVCPAGMVSYWPLDNNAENFVRDFADGVSNAVSFVDGNIGQAARFSSPESDIEVSHSLLNVSWPAFSIEAWIKPSDGSGIIFNKESAYELYLDNSIIKASLYTDESPDGIFLESDFPLTLDVWSHVVLSYDGSSASIYVNSAKVDSDALSGNIRASVEPFVIGARTFTPYDPFSGLIDEVAFYSVALPESLISNHYTHPVSYCSLSNFSEVFYCASDGDWTQDLDSKDSRSCRAAGFEWTGHQCCGEFDDPSDSYSDFSTPAVPINKIIIDQANAGQVSEYEVLLTDENAFVTVKGPSRVIVSRSLWRPEHGDMVLCSEKDETVSSFDLISGQSKKIVNYFYPAEPPCIYGRTSVLSAPVLAVGGCFDSVFYPGGSFLRDEKVVNYNGEFMACLQVPADLQEYGFISVKQDSCGSSLVNITPGAHGVCLPAGVWSFISIPGDTVVDETLWDPSDYGLDAYKKGCCPEDFCWNGTGCQPAGTFYRVNSNGFVCR